MEAEAEGGRSAGRVSSGLSGPSRLRAGGGDAVVDGEASLGVVRPGPRLQSLSSFVATASHSIS